MRDGVLERATPTLRRFRDALFYNLSRGSLLYIHKVCHPSRSNILWNIEPGRNFKKVTKQHVATRLVKLLFCMFSFLVRRSRQQWAKDSVPRPCITTCRNAAHSHSPSPNTLPPARSPILPNLLFFLLLPRGGFHLDLSECAPPVCPACTRSRRRKSPGKWCCSAQALLRSPQ